MSGKTEEPEETTPLVEARAGEPQETTPLVEARADLPSNNDVEQGEEDEGEHHYIPPNYVLATEGCAYRLYQWFSGVAALLSLIMFFFQLISYRTLHVEEHGFILFSENTVRTFCLIYCCALFFAELPVTSRLVAPALALHNWTYRGFLYCFISCICAANAQSALYAGFPQIPGFAEHVTVLIIKTTASSMFAIGVVYFIMGILCIRRVMDYVIDNYEEHVSERNRASAEE